MKGLKAIAALLILLSLTTGCEKEDDIKLSDSDYLIFGHFYGECVGEACVEILRLEESKLLGDTKDNYPTVQPIMMGIILNFQIPHSIM